MKRKSGLLMLLILGALVLNPGGAHPQTEKEGDRTLSPYFFVKSDAPEVDQLPLKSTSVNVSISGVIADVVVNQVYQNEGKKPLEAIYIFPASTRAAVYGMKMTIGERTITAQIREREAARREYEQARQAGKSASLLEQQRPNVFQMNVANILPSEVIKVELKYTELLVPSDAVYEFVYPTVVGPRYTNQPADQAQESEKWVENPHLHQGESPTYGFDIMANVAAGLPIQGLTCSSHKVNINYQGPTLASVRLDQSEHHGGNRDFVLKYRLAGGQIEAGLLLYKGATENFFLLMVQPPERVAQAQIPPREYIFVVDVSGSMHGFPLSVSKQLLKDLIGNLRPMDQFNVLLFAGCSSVMSSKALPATPQNIRRAIDLIDRQQGGGGTELLPALNGALCLPKAEGYSRSVIIITDGYVTVEEEVFKQIRNNLGEANVFTFGIGSSVNRHLIEGLARVGMGEPFVINRPEEAAAKARRFRELIQSPVLTGITIDFGEFGVSDVEPPSVPDVLAERPVIVFGKWRGRPHGTIQLHGTAGDGPFTKTVIVGNEESLNTNAALRYLWARHRVGLLSDYNRLRKQDVRVKEVTDLGLAYNLLTPYTSFVAIDARVRMQDGKPVTVKQPLPLPQGVSDYAVGGRGTALQKMAYAPLACLPSLIGERQETKAERSDYNKDHEISESLTTKQTLKPVQIELGNIMGVKGFSRKTVRNLIERQLHLMKKCHGQTLGDEAEPEGKVVFTLVVDAEGKVKVVHVSAGKLNSNQLQQCIIEKLKQLRFPAPSRGDSGMVTVSLILK